MSEPSRGVIARVRFNHPPSGRGREPKRVEHLQLGIAWRVTEILDRWEHPGNPEKMLGKPDLIKWWLLKVSGPLPRRPAELGEFVMELSFYGAPPGWWITVDPVLCDADRAAAIGIALDRAGGRRHHHRRHHRPGRHLMESGAGRSRPCSLLRASTGRGR